MIRLFQGTKNFIRFVKSYKDFAQRDIGIDDARRLTRIRIRDREENFLRLVHRNVFQNSRSPYLALFELAGCDFADLARLVSSEGLEPTLHALRREGVYFSFEEFKGRKPVIRGGQEIPVDVKQFDNKVQTGWLEGETSGSTGNPTRSLINFDHIRQAAPTLMLALETYDALGAPVGLWMTALPDVSGPATLLRFTHCRHVPQKWFTNVVAVTALSSRIRSAIYNQAVVRLGRLFDMPIPSPETLMLDQASVAAQWVSQTIKLHRKCIFYAQVSKGVRVALAALEEGLNLTGAIFVVGGEPVTAAKAATISQCGATCVPVYAFCEHGIMGLGCDNPVSPDEVHLFDDRIAMIQHPRTVPGHGIVIDSFHWTSLSEAAPKIMINIESDDYGIVDERSCGCPLGSLGFTKSVREIRSFSKMTAESVTLVSTGVVDVLEQVLPARFGGNLLDYQLEEEECSDGFTRVNIVIDPRVQIDDEEEVIRTFVAATAHQSVHDLWVPAGTLRVRRKKPLLTGRGKLLPLQLSNLSKGQAKHQAGVLSNT